MTEPRVSVVVVDDDGAVRRGLTRLLRVSGYDVETFASAPEFLEADLSQIVCLILDQHMPEMTGLELAKHDPAALCAKVES